MSPVTSSQSPMPKCFFFKHKASLAQPVHPATWPLVCKASGKMTTVQQRRSSQTWRSRRSWNSRPVASRPDVKTCETGTSTGWSMVFTSHAKERKPTILGVGVPTGNNDDYENHKVYPSIGFVWDPPIYTQFSHPILPV